jgi:hypothetical protein
MKIRAVRIQPGTPPEVVEIENSLTAMQTEVGGWIEALGLGEGVDAMCNEEGLLKDLPFNRQFMTPYGPRPVVGNVIVVAHDDEGETVGLSDAQVARTLKAAGL